ncbi:MAG TPA: hypothetical protein PLH56_01350 [Candidatus Omnitrophota bacterium]|nr:hypothetical protein [Candidatus Omnitrophota bacterium]HPN87965.1 hypothetical protein [Candidatus Omnitrophota bacterium]
MANKLTNIIEQLNNIKMEDLQKYFDIEKLKNINADEVKEFILSQPDLIVKIVFIALAFLTVTASFSSYNKKTATLRQEITKMEALLKSVDAFNTTKKEYDDFKKNFPQGLPSSEVLDAISEIANKNNVQIGSFSPTQEKDYPLWQSTTINITTSCENYNKMISFIKTLEDPRYAFRVDSWTATLAQTAKQGQTAENASNISNAINATITIGAVKLKNE